MHMEETAHQTQQPPAQKKDNSVIFYILGGLIITAVIVAGFLLYPKQSTTPESTAETGQPVLGEQTQQPATETAPANTPIGSLACGTQFYNTVNGVPGTYYLSTEGEVPTAGGQVTCTMVATVNNQEVQRVEITPTLVSVPERGGSTFKCTTQGIRLTPNTPTKVTTELKDANGVTASCNRTFLFP